MQNVRFFLGATVASLAVVAGADFAHADPSPTIPTTRVTMVEVDVTTQYDSNVAESSRELAALRGLTLADELITPSGIFQVARPLGAISLMLRGTGGYDFHRVNTIRDTVHFDFAAGADLHTGQCHESVVGDYAQSQSELSQLTVGLLNNTQDTTSINATAACGRQTGLAPKVSFTQSWLSNSSIIYKTVDNRTSTIDASLAYQRPAFGAASVFGTYEQATYPHRLFLGPNGPLAYGYKLYAGGFRYEHLVGSKIDLTAQVSYTALDPDSGSAQKFNGFTFAGDATYYMNTRLKTHVSVSRQTLPSTRPDSNFSVEDSYAADVSYLLGARLTLTLNADRKHTSFVGSIIPDPFRRLTEQTAYDVGGQASYTLNRRITLLLTAGDTEFQANLTGFSYSSTKIGIGVRATF